MACRLDTLPPDLVRRVLARAAGPADVLSTACASSTLRAALAPELAHIVWRGHAHDLAARLVNGVGECVEKITLRFPGTVECDAVSAVARRCPRLAMMAFCGVQREDGLGDAELDAFVGAASGALEELRVEFCGGISGDAVVRAVAALQGLRRLTVKFAGSVCDRHVRDIAEAMGDSLLELDVECSPGVGDESLYAIARFCPNVALLGVGGCPGVTDEGLSVVASGLGQRLLALDVRDNPGVTDEGMYNVANHCRKLEYLNAWRVGITSFGVCSVVETSGDSLRVLVIGETEDIDDEALYSIAEQCGVLDELEILGLPSVTDAGVAALVDARTGPPLAALSMDRCPRLSDVALRAVAAAPRMESVSMVGLAGVTTAGVAELREAAAARGMTIISDDSPPEPEPPSQRAAGSDGDSSSSGDRDDGDFLLLHASVPGVEDALALIPSPKEPPPRETPISPPFVRVG